MPDGRGLLPFAVGEEGRRLILFDQLLHHRDQVLHREALRILDIERMVPLIEGMIDTEADTGPLQGLLQLHGEVPMRAYVHAVPLPGIAGIVHTEAVMMLGHQVDILCAGLLEEFGPFPRIEELRLEVLNELLILEVLAVDPVVEGSGGRIGIPVHSPVPLRENTFSGVGRDGIDAPMDEDTEFRIGEPLRDGAGIQRLPGLFIMHDGSSFMSF